MERKTSLRIGPRTQQDILKDKVIRKDADGYDDFDDYWTDSEGENSTVSKKSDLSLKVLNEESSKLSQISCKASSLKEKPLESKKKLYIVSSDINENVSVNKENCAVFEDMTVNLGVDDNNPEAVALNKVVDNLVRNNLNSELPKIISVRIQNAHDIDKSLSQSSPKKDKVQVPVPKNKRSSQRSISRSTKIDAKGKELQSQYNEYDEKIMQMVHMDYDENVESSVVSGEESLIQQSSSIEGKRPEVERQTAIVSRSVEDKENIVDKLQMPIQKTRSQRSISRSTKIDAKGRELQSQYNEYDEKIMQMVHMNYNKDIDSSVVSEEESSIQQSSFIDDKRSEVEKQTLKDSKNIGDKNDLFNTSQHYNESPSKNTRSHNQSLDESVMAPVLNTHINKTKNASKYKKDKIELNCQTNANSTFLLNKNSSKPFICKKNSPIKSNTVHDSASSNEVSDSEIFSELANFEEQTNKQTVANERTVNTEIDSPKNIMVNDSPTKIIEKQKRVQKIDDLKKKLFVQHQSKTVVLKETSPKSSKDKKKEKSSKFYENDAFCKSNADTEANISDNEDNISEGELGDTSDLDDDNLQEHNIESQKAVTNKRSVSILDENIIDAADLGNLHQRKTFKRRKTLINKRNSSIPDNNYLANISVNSLNNSEVGIKKMSKKKRLVKKSIHKKSPATNESNYVPNENIVETADTDDLSQLHTSKKQNTRNRFMQESDSPAKISLNSSANSVEDSSEMNNERASKNLRKNKNNRQKTAANKSDYISRGSIVETDHQNNGISHLKTSKKQKTGNIGVPENTSHGEISQNSSDIIDNNSEVYDKKSMKNQRKFVDNKSTRKTAAIETDFHMSSNENVEISEPDDLSPLQNSKRMKTKKDALKQLSNISLNFSDNFFVSIPEVKNKNFARNQRKSKNNDSNKKIANNEKSYPKTDKSNLETKNLSQLKSSKKQKTKRSSISSVSDVNLKKNTEKESKIENNRSRHLSEKNDNVNHHLSKAKVAGKSKSTVRKSISDKAHKESNHATLLRRSTRQRYAPLARWRNERLLYRFEDGNIETIGIDKGTKEDIGSLEAIKKTNSKRNNKEKVVKPKKAKVLDVVEGKEKSILLQKKFHLFSWECPPHCKKDENNEFVYFIKRVIDTNKCSFGYIQIDVGKKKPSQFMPEEDLQLILLEGKVEINVSEYVYKLERKDMFIVPRGSAYSITNNGTQKALLSFSVGKFKFLTDA